MRTVLFFGDSNTRGYGVGREHRYAALLARQLTSDGLGEWKVEVATTESDFRLIPGRLRQALDEYHPDVVVWQCPTGPASYFPQLPSWYQRLRHRFRRRYDRDKDRMVEAEVKAAASHGTRTPREVAYEGLYLARLQRRRPGRWLGSRQLRRWLGRRYGSIPKATKDRYLEHVRRNVAIIDAASPAAVVLHGFVRHSEASYPGYLARTRDWADALRAQYQRPESRRYWIDTLDELTAHREGKVLLRDDTHLSRFGHECMAAAIAPTLERVLTGVDQARGS